MSDARFFAYVALISASVLAGALWFQYGLGLHPCELCLYQRYPWALSILISLIWFFVKKKDEVFIGIFALIFAVSSGLGLLHVGVEQGWWQWGGCRATLDISSIDALRQALQSAAIVKCDDVAWSLVGISMAGYNTLLSAVLALYCGYKGLKLCR